MEIKRKLDSQKSFFKKNDSGGLNLLQHYSETTLMKQGGFIIDYKDRNRDLWDSIVSPEIHISGQFIFNNCAKTIQWEIGT